MVCDNRINGSGCKRDCPGIGNEDICSAAIAKLFPGKPAGMRRSVERDQGLRSLRQGCSGLPVAAAELEYAGPRR
jgi:hypothetical protein